MSMNKNRWINTLVGLLSLLVVTGCVTYMTYLSQEVAEQEQQRVAIWAEATQRLIQANEDDDIEFYSEIIEQNTSIPVYMVDSTGQVILSRNVKKAVSDPTTLHGPIEVHIDEGDGRQNIQRIYYDESDLIWKLRFFPYIMVFLILVFVASLIALIRAQLQAEQNHVWVGLSKETAHQLGTPISSLNGWITLLASHHPNDSMLPEMQKDIDRLKTIAERFSKVGSEPELKETDLRQLVQESVEYMQLRVGRRVDIRYQADVVSALSAASAPLMGWVLENLIKNAVDAGATQIDIHLHTQDRLYIIDIQDNGRGIEGRRPNRVFAPGYTTKQRGWGLGLSLAKRIIEQYHKGRLTILSTKAGVGTTFRIEIRSKKA